MSSSSSAAWRRVAPDRPDSARARFQRSGFGASAALDGWRAEVLRTAAAGFGRLARPLRRPYPVASASSIDSGCPLESAEQADLQVKPRLQRELQILEQIERKLQIARQILFGELRRDLQPALLSRSATPRSTRIPRPPLWPPADSGNSAPARGRNAAGCARCAPAPAPDRASRANPAPPAPASPAPANRARTCPAARALPPRSSFTRSRRWPDRAPRANRARCLRPPAPARQRFRIGCRCLPCRRSTPCARRLRRNPPSEN